MTGCGRAGHPTWSHTCATVEEFGAVATTCIRCGRHDCDHGPAWA